MLRVDAIGKRFGYMPEERGLYPRMRVGEQLAYLAPPRPGHARCKLDSYSILAGCLALAGGLVAIVTLQVRRRFSGYAIAVWAALYAAFVVYVVSSA